MFRLNGFVMGFLRGFSFHSVPSKNNLKRNISGLVRLGRNIFHGRRNHTLADDAREHAHKE
jgi:hypothetical protein